MVAKAYQHGEELFDAWIVQLRAAYVDSVKATDGNLTALMIFTGAVPGGQQRRVDTRILAPQAAIDEFGAEAIITQILSDTLETFLFHDGTD